MNHLPFDWKDEVKDGHVKAYFVGGAWDGKVYDIIGVEEFPITSSIPKHRFINKEPDRLLKYDIAIYKRVISFEDAAIYWFTRIEKADE